MGQKSESESPKIILIKATVDMENQIDDLLILLDLHIFSGNSAVKL